MRRDSFKLVAAAVAVGTLLVAARAARADARWPAEASAPPATFAPPAPFAPPAAIAAASPPAPPARIVGVEASLAIRANRITSAGYDPFSSNDGLVATTLAAAYRFGRANAVDLAAGFEWGHASASSRARDSESQLDLDQLALTLKASLPLFERWSVFARLAPGAMRLEARLQESSARGAGLYETPVLSQTKWLPSVDLAAGTALGGANLFTRPLNVRLWFTAEGGYGYAPGYELALGGSSTDANGRSETPVRLGTLAMRGPFMRFGLALSF